jgi:hypothetical protein
MLPEDLIRAGNFTEQQIQLLLASGVLGGGNTSEGNSRNTSEGNSSEGNPNTSDQKRSGNSSNKRRSNNRGGVEKSESRDASMRTDGVTVVSGKDDRSKSRKGVSSNRDSGNNNTISLNIAPRDTHSGSRTESTYNPSAGRLNTKSQQKNTVTTPVTSTDEIVLVIEDNGGDCHSNTNGQRYDSPTKKLNKKHKKLKSGRQQILPQLVSKNNHGNNHGNNNVNPGDRSAHPLDDSKLSDDSNNTIQLSVQGGSSDGYPAFQTPGGSSLSPIRPLSSRGVQIETSELNLLIKENGIYQRLIMIFL